MAKSLVIWRYGYFDNNQNGSVDRGISGDGVIFLLLLKEIRLQLSHKASQQVLLQNVSHTAETDELSLVLWSTVSQNLSSSDHVGLLCTLSTIDTQESKLRVRLVLEVLVKLMVGENSSWEFPKVGVGLILEVHLILETIWYNNLTLNCFWGWVGVGCWWDWPWPSRSNLT